MDGKKFYICNRTMCKNCNPECRHTSVAARAKYKSVPNTKDEWASIKNGARFVRRFKKVNDGYFEIDPLTGKV